MVSIVEIRGFCLDELRQCEQESDPAVRRQHALRAMSFARLARRMAARMPPDDRDPLPADFVAALTSILARLSEDVDLKIGDTTTTPPR